MKRRYYNGLSLALCFLMVFSAFVPVFGDSVPAADSSGGFYKASEVIPEATVKAFEAAESQAMAAVTAYKKNQPPPEGLVGVAPTSSANNDGKITGTTRAMEYKRLSETKYKAVTGSEIRGLSAGTYQVRYAAKPGYNAGIPVTGDVPAFVPPKKNQPAPVGLKAVAPTSAANNDGKITGTTRAMEYKRLSDTKYKPAPGPEITGLAAGTYQVRYAAKPGYNAGAVVTGDVPPYVPPKLDQPAPTGLKGIAPTTPANRDGRITGTTSAMEYKLTTDTKYKEVWGSQIIRLSPGTYQVRYEAKPGYNAGVPAVVTVEPYALKNQPAPTGLKGIAPTSNANNDGKITGTTFAMEYKLSTDTKFKDVKGFQITKLTPGTYMVRYQAKWGYNAGDIANIVVPAYAAPNQDQPAPTGLSGVAPTAALNDGSITGTTTAMEYKAAADSTYEAVAGTQISGLVAGTYHVRYAAKAGFNAGADASVVVPDYVAPNQDQPAPTGLLGVAPTAALNDGSITGTTTAMEYKAAADSTYTAVTGTEITGLVAGTYQVRYAAKTGFNAGADADVIVPAYVAPNQDQPAPTGLLGVAPTAALNDGSITGTTAAMEYKLSTDTTYTAVTGTEITGLVAGTYHVRYAAKAGFNAGADADVIVPAYVAPNQDQPAPSGLLGVAPTAALNDGSITGTTAAMEYRLSTDTIYVPVTGTEITGLVAGTYQVRYAAKTGFNAGADADVVVPEYVAPNQDQPAPSGLLGVAPTAALNDGSITGTTSEMEYKAVAETTYTAVTGTEITGLVAGTYQVRYAAKTGFNAGADADVIVPAYVAPNQDQPAPTGLVGVAPTAALNDGSITGTTVAMEYKLSTEITYIPVPGAEITGLVAGTYHVRYAAKTGFNAGADADVIVPAYVAPNQDQPAPTGLVGIAPTAALNDGVITGTTTAMEYKAAADTTYTAVAGTEITGLVAGTYHVRYAAKTGFNAGADADVLVPAYVPPNQDQPAPTGLTGVAPTAALNDGVITGTTTAMEYKAAADTTYTAVAGTEITGLVAGTYQVRYAAKTGFNAGADADVVVPAYVAPNQDQPAPAGLVGVAPTAALNDGSITGTTTAMEYKLSTETLYTAVTGTEITDLVAGTYQVRYAAKAGFNAGADADVIVPAYVAPNQDQPAPTGLLGVAPTAALNDGSITGTTAAMEYKAAADTTYTAVTGTEITGLVAGTYQVRYAAKTGFNAGADADVIVPAYVAPNQDQPAPTGLAGIAPTAALNDGVITGTTTAMEYKLSTETLYNPVTGTEITGLAAGTYNVRYAAKTGFNAGADADVVVPAYVGVTSISLNKSSTSILVNGTETLIATILPAGASNKNVTWTSSVPGIATVDANGVVLGGPNGSTFATTVITVRTADGNRTATCSVRTLTEAMVVADVNSGTAANMAAKIAQYSTLLGLDMATYNAFPALDKTQVHGLLAAATFTALSEIKPAFDAAVAAQVAIQEINAATVDTVGAAVTKNAAILGVVLTDYNALTNNVPVHTALKVKSIVSVTEFRKTFNEAVAVEEINEATVDTMGAVIAKDATVLALVLTDYNALVSKTSIYTAMEPTLFTTPLEVRTAFNTAVAVQAINEATVATMGTTITKHYLTLGLSLTTYNTLINKVPVYTALETLEFATALEVKTAFDAAVAAQKLAETPVTPPAPAVTNDDVLNTVTGMAAGMEYNLDSAGYVAYDAATFNAINFSGDHTLLVRIAASGINPFGPATTLIFTADPVTLSSIAITSPAAKLAYLVGEPLDITGLVVTGTYSDGSTQVETITAADITGFDSTAPAPSQLLTVTIGGKTATYTVSIAAVPVTLSSIAITSPAAKLAYLVGEPLDITGLVVTGTYSDGSTQIETVTAADITGFDSTAPAPSQLLTVTIGGKTATYTVSIAAVPVTLSSIAITSPAAKLAYLVGEPLDITGLVVTGTYSDGSTQVETVTTADITGFDSTAPAPSQLLTVTIGGKTATYTVSIAAVPVTLSSIAITSPASKLAYLVGEPLDITGLVVTGTYSDGSTQIETVTAADITGFDSTAPAPSQLLTVTIGGKTATYSVSISAATQWPVEVESVNVFVEMFSGLTFVNIDIKAQYAGLVNQVLVNGIAANKMPGVNQWRINVPAGTTLASLQGNITIVLFADLIATATASRDFFGTTYVRVTMKPGVTATSVKANTVALTFNAGAGRWEGIFNTLNAGNPVTILATDGTGQTHQMIVLVTQL